MTDLQLVEFFNTYRQQVESFGIINVLDDRDDRRNYRKGQKIVESTIASARKGTRSYNLYTEAEIQQLVELYLQNDNLHWVRDTFIVNNPNQQHSADSVYQTVCQLRTMDTHYPEDTQWDVKSLVKKVATSQSARFVG